MSLLLLFNQSAPAVIVESLVAHAGRRASRQRRYWVEINGQIVHVDTPVEAQQLLRQVEPVQLAPPTVRTNLPESDALREARALLRSLYEDAARRATAALEAERRRWLQDQDDAQTLIALGDL
ncbi:hypothetical protein JZU48_03580 [bacterium]|nr:hypothetical protein [bacterium]